MHDRSAGRWRHHQSPATFGRYGFGCSSAGFSAGPGASKPLSMPRRIARSTASPSRHLDPPYRHWRPLPLPTPAAAASSRGVRLSQAGFSPQRSEGFPQLQPFNTDFRQLGFTCSNFRLRICQGCLKQQLTGPDQFLAGVQRFVQLCKSPLKQRQSVFVIWTRGVEPFCQDSGFG